MNLPQYRAFIVVAASFMLARWIAVVFIFFVIIASLFCPYEVLDLKKVRNVAFLSLVICALVGVVLGSRLKCPKCGKNMFFMMARNVPGYQRIAKLPFLQKISEFFFPRAFRTLEVNCANCDSHFILKKI